MALYLGSNKWNVLLNGEIYHPNCYIQKLIEDVDIPNYVKIEALELYEKVRSVKKDDSIIFLAMSDSHYPAEQTATTAYASNVQSTIIANQAAKYLTSALDFDFFAHLGDVSGGAGTTTPEMLKSQIEGFLAYFREAKKDIPAFISIGNHDAGIYYHDEMSDGNIYTMTGDYLYKNFTGRSASPDTVFGGEEYGGYCYRDFADKKLRVIMLNTSEKLVGAQSDQTTYGAQRVWLANALLDLNSKADAVDWGFIILCHYPADYGGTMPLSELLKAYVEGTSHTITDQNNGGYYVGDGTNQTVNFSGKNGAKFIAQFHGHVHNFKTSKLYSYATGSGVQYNAHRICIPNVQFDRENYYTTVGSYTDINFAEDISYTKTANTANGTSFVVNVINPSEQKIYSFCYGAGYDRVIGYNNVIYHTINRMLSNTTTNSTVIDVANGASYSEIITLNSGYEMKSITVTIGGVDVSSTAISMVDGKYQISISNVTGNIVITAKASLRPNFTNLVPLSVDSDGSDYNVDGDGYDNGVYTDASYTLSNNAAYTTTGYIPISFTGERIIRVTGDGILFPMDDVYCRISFYNADFSSINMHPAHQMATGNVYQGTVIEEDTTALTWKISTTHMPAQCNAPYMRISAKGDGANLIVTVNEEITYGGSGVTNYTVSQNLTNVTSSNSQTIVTSGSLFSTTLTAKDGGTLSDVTVIMGGVDVTSSVYSNGVISISNVTGNIVITAKASVVFSGTNQLPISTDASGNVYNGTGYKVNTYLSAGAEGTRSGVYTSGFIPVKYGDTLYFKNCTIQAEQSNHRFMFYDSSKTWLTNREYNTTSSHIISASVYGSDGNMIQLNIDNVYWSNTGYIRFCCSYLGEDSIVTVNEPIK